jgi:hypothetical protein
MDDGYWNARSAQSPADVPSHSRSQSERNECGDLDAPSYRGLSRQASFAAVAVSSSKARVSA